MERSKVWNKSGKKPKPMNKVGKGGRRTTKSNKQNKDRFIREGIDRCQLCGSDSSLSNSHSKKEDRRDENAKTALLCIWPCHQFLELKCTAEERRAINEFLIETTLEGWDKFKGAVAFLPTAKAQALASIFNVDIMPKVELTMNRYNPGSEHMGGSDY